MKIFSSTVNAMREVGVRDLLSRRPFCPAGELPPFAGRHSSVPETSPSTVRALAETWPWPRSSRALRTRCSWGTQPLGSSRAGTPWAPPAERAARGTRPGIPPCHLHCRFGGWRAPAQGLAVAGHRSRARALLIVEQHPKKMTSDNQQRCACTTHQENTVGQPRLPRHCPQLSC